MSTILIIFLFLSAITLATTFLTIFSRNPIHSALCDLFLLYCGSLLIIEFSILVVHIIVYSGAIMILFFFHDHVNEFE
jgi:NADH-quinone oxidoreductase subunit J